MASVTKDALQALHAAVDNLRQDLIAVADASYLSELRGTGNTYHVPGKIAADQLATAQTNINLVID